MYILYSQRGVCLFHTCLAGSLFCNCNKKFECVLHEIAFLFCSGAQIEAAKAALSVLPVVTGEMGHAFHHFRPLHLPVPCGLWKWVCAHPVAVCVLVHLLFFVMAVVLLPQNRCVCVTLLCPRHVLGWRPTGVSRVSRRAEAPHPDSEDVVLTAG